MLLSKSSKNEASKMNASKKKYRKNKKFNSRRGKKK